jgi:hypothetical protein
MDAVELKTIRGLQAKAKMLLHWYWDGGGDEDDPIASEIIKGLATVQLAA